MATNKLKRWVTSIRSTIQPNQPPARANRASAEEQFEVSGAPNRRFFRNKRAEELDTLLTKAKDEKSTLESELRNLQLANETLTVDKERLEGESKADKERTLEAISNTKGKLVEEEKRRVDAEETTKELREVITGAELAKVALVSENERLKSELRRVENDFKLYREDTDKKLAEEKERVNNMLSSMKSDERIIGIALHVLEQSMMGTIEAKSERLVADFAQKISGKTKALEQIDMELEEKKHQCAEFEQVLSKERIGVIPVDEEKIKLGEENNRLLSANAFLMLEKENWTLQKDAESAKLLEKEAEVKRLSEALGEVEKENTDIQHKLQSQDKSVEKLRVSMVSIEKERDLLREENVLQRERITALLSEIDRLTNELQKTSDAGKRVAILLEQVESGNKTEEALRLELVRAKEEKDQLEAEVESHIEQVAVLRSELQTVRREMREALATGEKKHTAIHIELISSQQSLENLKTTLAASKKETDRLQSENGNYKQQISALRNQLNDVKNKMEESLNTGERKLENLNQQLRETEATLEKLRKRLTCAEEERDSFRDAQERHREEVVELRYELQTAKNELSAASAFQQKSSGIFSGNSGMRGQRVNFGRYNGETYGWVIDNEPGYVRWAINAVRTNGAYCTGMQNLVDLAMEEGF